MARNKPNLHATTSAQVTRDRSSYNASMLEAYNEMESLSANKAETVKISLLRTHEDNIYNKKDTDEAIAELAENIKNNGLLHNIVITQRPDEDGYVIISGERRYKAYKKLYQAARDNDDVDEVKKYATIPCKIISIKVKDESLRRNAEQIYLDAANVFTREGISDTDLFEKVTVRYVNNLMLIYGISETEAKRSLREQIKAQSGVDKKATIDRNIKIYRDLLPELYEFIQDDENGVSKKDSLVLSNISTDAQKLIIDEIKNLKKNKSLLGDEYRAIYSDYQKKVTDVADSDEKTQMRLVEKANAETEEAVALVLKTVRDEKKKTANLPEEIAKKNRRTVEKLHRDTKKLANKVTNSQIVSQIKSGDTAMKNDLIEIKKIIDKLCEEASE